MSGFTGNWHVCPWCGFDKHFETGETGPCNSCAERGHVTPEPLVPYNFDVPAPSRKVPQHWDGAGALNAVELAAWLDLERAYSDVIDIEIRHIEGP